MTFPKHSKTPATAARGKQPEGQLGRELLLGTFAGCADEV